MKREISAGGIVFRKDIIRECEHREHSSKPSAKPEIKILMIKDPTDRWVFPKGLIDKGETKEQAAIREVKEETGLKELRIIAPLGQIKFFYKWQGETIFKIVYFFLMETSQKELKHQKEEIKAAEWVPIEEVLERNSHKNQDEIVKKAIEKIKHTMKKKTLKDF